MGGGLTQNQPLYIELQVKACMVRKSEENDGRKRGLSEGKHWVIGVNADSVQSCHGHGHISLSLCGHLLVIPLAPPGQDIR